MRNEKFLSLWSKARIEKFFFCKGQTVNTFHFVGYRISVSTTQPLQQESRHRQTI